MSSDEAFGESTPPEIRIIAEETIENLLHSKSKEIYELEYTKSMNWRFENRISSFSETVVLAYFTCLSEKYKSSTLWKIYSMLRSVVNIKHNVNLAVYAKLRSFLKRKSEGYQAKKSQILTAQQISRFIKQAPDEINLGTKVPFVPVSSQITDETSQETTTKFPAIQETTAKMMGPFSAEIMVIYVPPGIGNAVKLIWGGDLVQEKANLTYGLHYGVDEGELEYPKMTTPNFSAIVEDLEYCTRYHFAVTVLDGNGNQPAKVNPNTVRTVFTGIDQMAAPVNLTAELEPRAQPCLDIKWSAACPNVVSPIGYVVSVLDKETSKYQIITLPRTKRSDLVYRLPVKYGNIYEVRVSTNFPGSKALGPLKYQVPEHLQPFKVKVTVNQDDQAFLIYWTEPYVPLTIGRYYYQVFVYPSQDLEAPYEKYYVTRPVMVYKGERGEYSFSVNLASNDRKHVSSVTTPIYANLNGDSYVLNATFTETPDR